MFEFNSWLQTTNYDATDGNFLSERALSLEARESVSVTACGEPASSNVIASSGRIPEERALRPMYTFDNRGTKCPGGNCSGLWFWTGLSLPSGTNDADHLRWQTYAEMELHVVADDFVDSLGTVECLHALCGERKLHWYKN